MAKCIICSTKKGKRKCQITDGMICSLCCGNTRIEETCSECTYYQKPKRKYNEVPSYSPSDIIPQFFIKDLAPDDFNIVPDFLVNPI